MQKPLKEQKMVVMILLSNIFIVFLGVGLIIPVMPSFMHLMHLSGSTMGYLVAAFALAQLIISPFAGRWVDTFGRKKMIVIGLVIFGISELIFGLGTHVFHLYFSRILGGVAGAFIMPAVTAYIADITTMQERSKAMGYLSAAISTGFIIGPGAGGFIAEFGIRTPFYVAGILGFVVALSSLFILKEPVSRTQGSNDSVPKEPESTFMQDLKKSVQPVYLIAFIIVFVLAFGLSAYETVFSLFSDQKFGFTPRDIATIVTLSSIVAVIFQILLFGKVVNAIGEKKMIQLCLIVGAVLAFVSTMISGFFVVLLVTTFIFLAFDLLRPTLTTYLSKTAGEQQGFVAGMNSTYNSLGTIFGPALSGILFDSNIHYPYIISGVVILVGLGLTVFWKAERGGQTLNALKH